MEGKNATAQVKRTVLPFLLCMEGKNATAKKDCFDAWRGKGVNKINLK
jgi:hypothetical protein